MLTDKWFLVEIVLTLAGVGTVMVLVRERLKEQRFANLIAALAGIGILCVLHLLGLTSASYILFTLLLLSALGFFLGQL